MQKRLTWRTARGSTSDLQGVLYAWIFDFIYTSEGVHETASKDFHADRLSFSQNLPPPPPPPPFFPQSQSSGVAPNVYGIGSRVGGRFANSGAVGGGSVAGRPW